MDTPVISTPKLAFAMQVQAEIGPPVDLGVMNGLRKRMIPITGGSFEGPGIKGDVLPGGADWQDIRPDGVAEILALYPLRTEDGVYINVRNPGFSHAAPGVLQKMVAGEPFNPNELYFRTTPQLSVAADSKYAWLGKTVFTGSATLHKGVVVLDFYAVK